jgi:hypothetical protein
MSQMIVTTTTPTTVQATPGTTTAVPTVPGIQQSPVTVHDYVYIYSSAQQNDFVIQRESGRSLEDISSRIFWNITKEPKKENMKILKSDYTGFYEDDETEKVLGMSLKRTQSSRFYYVLPLLPGFTAYSSIKEIRLDPTASKTLKNLLEDVYNFYQKKIIQGQLTQPQQPPSSSVTLALDFKSMILRIIPAVSPYTKFIDELLSKISTASGVNIFHQIFSFRTMFNGFLTTPNPEIFQVTEQGTYRTVTDYIYILNLSNSIIPVDNSVGFESVISGKNLKNIIKQAISEQKQEKFEHGGREGQHERGRGSGRWQGGFRGGQRRYREGGREEEEQY